MKPLEGKVVFLTGAGSGIGRALAKGFLQDGARVVALNRSRAPPRSSLRDKRLITVIGDVRSETDVRRAIKAALDRFGRIDILVNNAGVSHTCEFAAQSPAVWAEQILVNLVGAALCTHHALRAMVKQGHGRIVNIGSRDGETARAFASGYSASKAGLAVFARSLSRELNHPNAADILINTVIPGPTRTGMSRQGQDPEEVYPFVRDAATLPKGGPNGRVFFRGQDYPFFGPFAGHDATKVSELGSFKGDPSAFRLSPAEITLFREQGFLGPIRIFDPAEMAEIRVRLEQQLYQAPDGVGPDAPPIFHVRNRHLDLPLVARLCRHPALVERVASVLGPDLLLWRSNFFNLSGKAGEGLPWHQDRYLTLLAEPRTNISAQLAITEASERNCMLFIPGTHRLTRAQLRKLHGLELMPGSDGGEYGTPGYVTVGSRGRLPLFRVVMEPGQCVIFDESLLHCSSVADEASPRMALAVRVTVPNVHVLPAAFAETQPLRHTCALLRGKNRPALNALAAWPVAGV
jgi:NAD(P)-dependent dehydrogenase (short-subunit alcohol dehydrogenase family)